MQTMNICSRLTRHEIAFAALTLGTAILLLPRANAADYQGAGIITAKSYQSGAVDSTGKVLMWGYNYYRQLGDGTTIPRYLPVQVSNLTDVVSIAAGFRHTLAVRVDGTV